VIGGISGVFDLSMNLVCDPRHRKRWSTAHPGLSGLPFPLPFLLSKSLFGYPVEQLQMNSLCPFALLDSVFSLFNPAGKETQW
jgi:hypothetical protein